ncbi:type III pantothenate kinase [Mesoplasma photuris]|uniref:type III pantothenate kinase n=1 Tax=Mesoplasma photuris TaxID=217731 RepID=UPI0004E1975A|nr:type III pantothenate kinase [Mesoplasma photuris]
MKKILIDIGNTTIHIKKIDQNNFSDLLRINTKQNLDQIKASFNEMDLTNVSQVVYSSVVPAIGEFVKNYFKKFEVINVKELKDYSNDLFAFEVNGLGEDFIANLLAVKDKFKNGIIISLGTATTFSLVRNGKFSGAIIAPGIRNSLNSLISAAAQLDQLEFGPTEEIIGTNTLDSINIGAINGHWFMIEKQIESLSNKFDCKFEVIFTGGNAKLIEKFIIKNNYELDYDLIFKGLNK